MTIAPSTRSRCDECDSPAVLTHGDAFLCERCDQILNGAVEDSIPSNASRLDGIATVAASAPGSMATVAPNSTSSMSTLPQVDATNLSADAHLPCPKALSAPEARKPLGAAFSFEAEVSKLEAEWLRDESNMLQILQLDGANGLGGVHDA